MENSCYKEKEEEEVNMGEWPKTFYLHLCWTCSSNYYGESATELAPCPLCGNTDNVVSQAVKKDKYE